MTCAIRKWRPSDAADLAAALSNKNIQNNLRDGLPYPYTESDGADYIAAMLAADPDRCFAYAVTVDDRAVGSIGAFRQDNIHGRSAELGYYLAEPYWGRGLMTDAVKQLCALVFARSDILRIYAEPFSFNTGSRRVLEKAGFQFEGLMKSAVVKNGRVQDMALYALTRPETPWQLRRLARDELPAALELCRQGFLRSVAPDCAPEGVEEFLRCLDSVDYLRPLDFYAAFTGGELAGVLALRPPRHISLFFVREDLRGRGAGRRLFRALALDHGDADFTVNAAPGAVAFYRRLGFVPTAGEQLTNGIRYTPMRREAEA